MRILPLIFYLCLVNVYVTAQRRPQLQDEVNLLKKADGYWYESSKTGPDKKLKIDSSQVSGFSQLVNKVNSRTVFQNLLTLRKSKLKINEAPGAVNIIDQGIAGTFVLDNNDNKTSDNTGRVVVTASGLRYKRIISGGQIELAWYGAKGDGIADDTEPVQRAVDDALAAVNPAVNGELPRFAQPGTVLVPVGTFKISSIHVNGSIRIIGQGGGTYAGSFFLQKQPGMSMLLLGADKDGKSNSTVIENICFKSASGTLNQNVAQIKTVSNISSNSIYVRNCWFKTPENYSIWLTQGDDIQISGCTFDVSAFHAIRLGTKGGGGVSNCTITNNTFYQIKENLIKVENVTGVVISSNRAYSDDLNSSKATFINGADATKIDGLTLVGNEYNNIPRFAYLETSTKVLVISGNVGYNTNEFLLYLTGGGVVYGASIIGNSAYSRGKWNLSPISCIGCGLQNSIILGNTFFATEQTDLGMNMPDPRTINNIIDKNIFKNFSLIDNIINRPANGQFIPQLSELKSGDMFYFDGKKVIRIPKGDNGQVLKMISGVPSWSN